MDIEIKNLTKTCVKLALFKYARNLFYDFCLTLLESGEIAVEVMDKTAERADKMRVALKSLNIEIHDINIPTVVVDHPQATVPYLIYLEDIKVYIEEYNELINEFYKTKNQNEVTALVPEDHFREITEQDLTEWR